MVYARIHAIKATVQKALKYICNPKKTDGQILIDSFACGIETAHYDFIDALSKSSGVGNKQAFHLIQSFAPGEVDFNIAHKVGIELAEKLLENKYSYVIAMTAQKAKLKKIYQTAEKEAEEADKQLKNIRQYLGLERDTRENEKTNKKHDISL